MLPREKDAVDPGFELKYDTVTAAVVDAKSTSHDVPYIANAELTVDLGFDFKHDAVTASVGNAESTLKDAPYTVSSGVMV